MKIMKCLSLLLSLLLVFSSAVPASAVETAAPAATIAVLRFLPMAQDAKMCILVMMACPSAALTIIYAVQNDTEPEMCANTVLLSTLAFAVTLPAVIALAQLVL